MKTNDNWLKITAKLGLFLMIGVSMSACSATWKEEALQNDGSTIMVERSVERGGRHAIGQEPPIKQQSLAFISTGANPLAFNGTLNLIIPAGQDHVTFGLVDTSHSSSADAANDMCYAIHYKKSAA
ncbi:MAG: hypothetical protein ACYCSS_07610 [Sulfuriferula sp.]